MPTSTLVGEILIFGATLSLAPLLMLLATFVAVRRPELRRKITIADRVAIANLAIAVLAIVVSLYAFVRLAANDSASNAMLQQSRDALTAATDELRSEEAQVRGLETENAALRRVVSTSKEQYTVDQGILGATQSELDTVRAENAERSAELDSLRCERLRAKCTQP